MTGTHQRLAARVAELIRRFGQEVTWTAPGPATYDPTGGSLDTAPRARRLSGLVESYRVEEIGGAIKTGDQRVTLAAAGLSAPPAPGDHVDIAGARWRVLAVAASHAGAGAVLYTLHLRR